MELVKRVDDHEKRIRVLEVDQAVLIEHVKFIRKWAGWGIALLGGSVLLQFVEFFKQGISQ